MLTPPYRILRYLDLPCLLCLVCNTISHNPIHIAVHFCGHCALFLDQLPDDYPQTATNGRSPGLLLDGAPNGTWDVRPHLPDGVDVQDVSDGYHTFRELYEHRCVLFLALMHAHAELSWKSRQHADGTMFPGWFIAGMTLSTGEITYHLPDSMFDGAQVRELARAPAWDGHTASEVVTRLRLWQAISSEEERHAQ